MDVMSSSASSDCEILSCSQAMPTTVASLDKLEKELFLKKGNDKSFDYCGLHFEVRDDADMKLLSEEMARQFHRTTAQLLFLCKRARQDIETLVSFLTTRVKDPDEDDWGKLRHGLMYLKGTLHMKRYLSADGIMNIT